MMFQASQHCAGRIARLSAGLAPLHGHPRRPSTVSPPRSITCRAADDEAIELYEDWRAFRAQLLRTQQNVGTSDGEGAEGQGALLSGAGSRASADNLALLSLQRPDLAAEGCWAHATPGVEQGGVLLATPVTAGVLQDERLEQVVVLVLSHGPQGSVGIVINRPTSLVLGKQKGGLRFDITNAPPDMQRVFADARVYSGGLTAQSVVHVLHGMPLPGAQQVVQGIYAGGEATATQQVAAGRLRPDAFKFFMGAMVWEPGALQREVTAGCWYCAACSRSLVLKPVLQLPTPLWREVMLLMGGEHADVAHSVYEGDEVSGE